MASISACKSASIPFALPNSEFKSVLNYDSIPSARATSSPKAVDISPID